MQVLDDLFPSKHSIANELYIKTADENYIVARGCSFYSLETDFFWLAAHCLEKYTKAALLLNEQSGKEYVKNGKKTPYRHDIDKLYENIWPLAPELLQERLMCPRELHGDAYWVEETTADFIHRLRKYGQPDNRYQFVGYVKKGQDLLKLDQVVFAIRRARPHHR